MYLDKAKKRYQELLDHYNSTEYQTIPCKTEALERLSQELGLNLPAAYQEFLLWMGGGAGRFIDHMYYGSGQVPYHREDTIELMENDASQLPMDAIVFAFGHQGYFFYFIRSSEGDNPPVHKYYEEEGFKWNIAPSLEDFLLPYIEALINYYKKQQQSLSPEEEEKKKKLLEQQNKLEEKKQELAKAEKKIANFQKRINNLSGDKLSGIKFNNPSVAKIKELEKDLRTQKVVKQNIEKEITKLEEEIN